MNIGSLKKRASAFWRGLSMWGRIGAGVFLLVLVVAVGYLVKGGGSAATAEVAHLRAVQVASVTDLENDTMPLPLIGQVKSVNEAEIRTQAAGPIKRLNYRLGSYVSAGAAIAEIDNAAQRAALLQAQGTLEAAQASVQKGDKLFGQSKTSAVNTIKAAYSSNDDLIHSKLDVVFSNPSSFAPKFVLSVTDQSLLNKVQSERLAIETILKEEAARADLLTENSDLKAEIRTAISETRQIKSFIDDLSALLNVSISSQTYSDATISGFVTAASLARTSVSATLASLTGAEQALTNAQTTGDTPDDASASGAALKQAQAAVDAAQASLNNTIIRAPISGTLNNLSINLGDFVSAFQQVAVVSNNGALEITAYITPEDRSAVSVGSKVKIEGQYDGQVVSIAPAIDPATKKIEIKISFSAASFITNGQSVHLEIARPTTKKVSTQPIILLPIAAIKIEPDRSVVFTVNNENRLEAQAVTTGQIVGDKIQILTGVTRDMKLVVDARGLKDGQQVELQ